jgi:hypothetical protein
MVLHLGATSPPCQQNIASELRLHLVQTCLSLSLKTPQSCLDNRH